MHVSSRILNQKLCFNHVFRKMTIIFYYYFCADPSNDSAGAVVKPYQFRMSEIEGFRYRVTVRASVIVLK